MPLYLPLWGRGRGGSHTNTVDRRWSHITFEGMAVFDLLYSTVYSILSITVEEKGCFFQEAGSSPILYIEMDLAESGINRKTFMKKRVRGNF